MKRWLGFALVGISFGLLTQSCGSSNDKKKAGPGPDPGGDAGETANGGSGAKSGSGGKGGAGNSSGTGNGGDSGSAGDSGAGDGGMSATAGTTGSDCPTGFGECDDDATTSCEQDLSLVTSCGDCTTKCNSKNGTATCVDLKCALACSTGFGDCNDDPNDGCEATLASNATNCGACGRNCAAEGATCMVDKCSAIPLQTNAPGGQDNAGNRTWEFSTLGLLHLGSFNYDVTRFPLDGSAPSVIWQSVQKSAGNHSLLVVDDTVYWSEWGTSGNDYTASVFKKKLDASPIENPVTAFVPEWNVQFLRHQGNALYWASGEGGDAGGYIYTRALDAPDTDPGTKIVTADQSAYMGIYSMEVTSDAIYWVTQTAGTGKAYELRTTPLSGGTPSVVPEVFANTGTPITSSIVPSMRVLGNTLYFTRTVGDAQDGVYSFKKGDAKPKKLVQAASIIALLLDDDSIYYVIQNLAGIFKAPITGGAGVSISPNYATRLAGQDAKFVYFVANGTYPNSNLFKTLK